MLIYADIFTGEVDAALGDTVSDTFLSRHASLLPEYQDGCPNDLGQMY